MGRYRLNTSLPGWCLQFSGQAAWQVDAASEARLQGAWAWGEAQDSPGRSYGTSADMHLLARAPWQLP